VGLWARDREGAGWSKPRWTNRGSLSSPKFPRSALPWQELHIPRPHNDVTDLHGVAPLAYSHRLAEVPLGADPALLR
jgi:hypothetical protein